MYMEWYEALNLIVKKIDKCQERLYGNEGGKTNYDNCINRMGKTSRKWRILIKNKITLVISNKKIN